MSYALPLQNTAHNCQRLNHRSVMMIALSVLLGVLPFMPFPATALEAPTAVNLADGVYLFGESSEADQIGATYMVTEVADGNVIGGFYRPHSSFDCFYGTVEGNAMALTVIDSYERTEHAFSVALESREPIATQTGAVSSLVPEGFQVLPELSETAAAVLQTCRSDL